ncbi:MAG: Trm112 family protein [Pseudomonadota bacterium]
MTDASTPSDAADGDKPSVRPSVDRKLLDILVCPVTKTVLHYDHEAQELISYAAKVAYPIRDSIPIMLIEEARELTGEEIAGHKASPKGR